MRSRRRRPSTRPARGAGIPAADAVPPPHAITGTSASAASATIARTSSTVPGNTAASGVRPSTTYGDRSTPVRRWGAPTRTRSFSRRAACTLPRASEALGQALLFDGVRPVRNGAGFTARLARREHLPGITEPVRIEGVLEALHQREVGRREDERHEVHFLEPDAVLARDGAADLGAHLHDLGAGGDDARLFARLARIVEDVRMQVAVTGVEDVADAQAVRADDLVDAPEHVRQLRAGNHTVHHHVGGGHSAVGAERGLASLPEQ